MIFISEKCKELRISFVKNEPQFARIVIDGKELERVTSAKLLGMTISSNLTWNEHISDVIIKKTSDSFRNSFIIRSCIDNIYT